MKEYNFILPFPVSVNAVWRKSGRTVYLSDRSKKYRIDVAIALVNQMLFAEHIKNPVIVSIELNPPTTRKYDVDNFFKSLFDALTYSSFWLDDGQVIEVRAKKGKVTKGGNVTVCVNVID